MSEDELQELVKTVAEAHAGLSEVAFKLRRELTPKRPCAGRQRSRPSVKPFVSSASSAARY